MKEYVISQIVDNFKATEYTLSFNDLKDFVCELDWSAGVFNNDYRNNDNFKYEDLFILDIDDGLTLNQAREMFKDYKHIIATSRNHNKDKPKRGVKDRFRVVLFLDKRITTLEDHTATWLHYKNTLFPFMDPVCKDPARQYYRSPEIVQYNEDGTLIKVKHSLPKKEKYPVKKFTSTLTQSSINWSNKPKWLTNCRWALQNGEFGSGERSNSLMVLAATYKNQGFDLDHTYRLLKGVAELQSKKSGQERYSDEEIYNNVINQVYSENWKGGQYSCKEPGSWLHEYCNKLEENRCSVNTLDSGLVPINKLSKKFVESTKNIRDNIIPTGFKQVDNNVKLMNSTLVGLLGAPGSAKTTISLRILEHNSKQGNHCLFYSLDMAEIVTYAKLVQMSTGQSLDQILEMFAKGEKGVINDVTDEIDNKFKNVTFNFSTGIQVEDIREDILRYESEKGVRPKLVVIDYLECMSSTRRDTFDNTTEIAQKLKRLVNLEGVMVLLLLQPNKVSGDPSEPIMSYNSIKGPQAIAAECRTILSVHREGFSPTNPDNDKFITINVIKNTFGGLSSHDHKWNGKKGEILELNGTEKAELDNIRALKNGDKSDNSWD